MTKDGFYALKHKNLLYGRLITLDQCQCDQALDIWQDKIHIMITSIQSLVLSTFWALL